MSQQTKYLVLAIILAGAFGLLWYQGQLKRMADYYQQTREELRKCAWPTWEELKGSTVVITLSIALFGGFTILVDQLLFLVFFKF